MDMEDRVSTVITARNTGDKRIGTYALCIALLAVISFVNFFLLTFVPLSPSIKQILTVFDYVVALIFLADFVFRFLRAPKKWAYMRTWGWLDLLSGVPIPFFSIARIVRVARVAVAVRKMRYKDMERSITKHPARSTLIATGFLTLLVVVAGSALELQFEVNAPHANIHSGGDALWWAMVSIATVGYGDKYPVTTAGRITAVFVIGVGVVLFGVISSYLASTFIASRERVDKEAIIAALKGDLDTIKTEVDDLKEGFGNIQAEMAEIKQLLLERKEAS
jgi:voltage-gated potassium channel